MAHLGVSARARLDTPFRTPVLARAKAQSGHSDREVCLHPVRTPPRSSVCMGYSERVSVL
jgi:hypothetical protein